ncbi:MAG: hypothetical protein HUJ77_14530 [Clostridium sp.]|uniref:hypothetical protein n=1 Tax=Clostridium sp. TaxID=1506 RepID=UPI0025BD96B4|nr:hypothetical protein [Clostridium sp.]MCF0149598.1 hypothetical protein [Clostridium sp.]
MNEQISIRLTSDVSYINGTVNNVSATFTLTSENTWSATVPKSRDGKYLINITVYKNSGVSYSYITTLYRGYELIPCKTNWSKDDYYNYDDLNRVECNINYIADTIATFRDRSILQGVKVDRNNTSIEFSESLNRIESNIQSICDSFHTPVGFLGTKTDWRSGQYFDYKEANRLEDNIEKIYKLVVSTINAFKYCGAFTCGGDGI